MSAGHHSMRVLRKLRSGRLQCCALRIDGSNRTVRSLSSIGTEFQGESGTRYRLVAPLTAGKDIGAHVWKAVDVANGQQQFVVKRPKDDGNKSHNLAAFLYELEMQNRFRDAPFIRRMVDFTSGCSSTNSPPWMILEGYEKTLWTARLRRRLSFEEIRWIMKAVLLGLWTIHREGLVYSDLKMENVVLNGSNNQEPGDVRLLSARLADCGLITKISDKEISSPAYRSPEVYFKKGWNASTDIWSWGIVYCHLLEACVAIDQLGIHESGGKGTAEEIAATIRSAMSVRWDCATELWVTRLLNGGIPADEVNFVFTVLNPDPTDRWSAEDIIKSGYLDALQ